MDEDLNKMASPHQVPVPQPDNAGSSWNANHAIANPYVQDDPDRMWRKIRRAVSTSRRCHMSFATKIPHDFNFMPIDPTLYPDRNWMWPKDIENYAVRLFFLGILPGKRENELLYVDVPHKPNPEFIDKAVEWKPVVSMFQGSYAPTYSREEELLRERKRVGVHGVASYEISQDNVRILFPAGGDLYYIDADQLGRMNPNVPKYMSFKHEGVKIDSKMSPSNHDLVAYIMNNDLWVKHIATGDERRLTFANKGHKDITKEPISAGVTSYVIQEEFDRYTGYWWQPNTPTNVQRILYEEVDESEVQILHIFSPMSEPNIDSYRYPRAGTKNAKVQLKLVEFQVSGDGLVSDPVIKTLPQKLETLFPWVEYIVRVDWLSSGEGVCVQVLDRAQQRTAVLYIPFSLFNVVDNSYFSKANDSADVEMNESKESGSSSLHGIKILLEEFNQVWINVSDAYYFYKHNAGSNKISFVWSSERTGHRHLYYVQCWLNQSPIFEDGTPDISNTIRCMSTCQTLTAGNWDVMEHNDAKTALQMWVKEETGQIFFVGLKDTVLESHLYMANPMDPANPIRLTQLGRSHVVSMDKLYKLTEPQLRPIMFMNLLEATEISSEYSVPQLFSYQSQSGFEMHGMVHRPNGVDPGEKCPTVVYVYGGPRVQMVTNGFKGLRFGRIFTYTYLGYAVVTIDGRGSAHRGLAFEGAVKNRLGQVEVEDQVEGLLEAAKRFDCIDLKRVAIHGWSYGGYLSLMGLAERPDIFKMAICGAPVTSWEMYDTGYTERYMGVPECNVEGVIDENVHFVHTAHLVNALIRCCRPYHLQIYPSERHGLRSAEGNEHFETIVLMYLQQYL